MEDNGREQPHTRAGKDNEMRTLVFLWDLIRNPDVVWVDAVTGEEAERERMTRRDRWHTFRPMWTFRVFTYGPGCGCRKRLWWPVVWCSTHAFGQIEGRAS